MKIAHIFSIKNQDFYQQESVVMILAHLLKKGLYNPANFSSKQYIILDNGLYEKAQVSTRLQDLVDLAEKSNIPIREIIVPDVVNDLDSTKKLFISNLDTIKKWGHKYKFMFVAQARTYPELRQGIDFANSFQLNLSVGISKLSPLDRGSAEAITCYLNSKHPIHLLGIKNSFREVLPVSTVVRSCDSSQVSFIVKNNVDIYHTDLVAYQRSGSDIDLETDDCDKTHLYLCRDFVNKVLGSYDVLKGGFEDVHSN